MLIGKAGSASTSISTADAASVTVRGRDLCGDLMGRLSFTDYFHLLVTGREPTEEQRFFLDLLLVAIAEHGLVPTNQVARMTYDADPGALQGAVAAGILGCGSVVLGTAEACGRFLAEARGRDMRAQVAAIRAAGGKVPGFGHPLHKPVDPRAQRIMALAEARGVAAAHCALAREAEAVVPEVWGKPLPMNVSHADRGGAARSRLPAGDPEGRADPRAHRRRCWRISPRRAPTRSASSWRRRPRRRSPTSPARATDARCRPSRRCRGRRRPAPTTRPTAAQVAYLFERSPFYRDKLRGGGLRATRRRSAASTAIAALPFTEKDELRASRSVAHPIGAHLAAPMADVVRIYSTSGTTGTPSYIPLTAEDLGELDRRSPAGPMPLGRRRRASGSSRPTAPGPFVGGGRRSTPSRRSASAISRSAPGNTERLLAAVDAAGARTRWR